MKPTLQRRDIPRWGIVGGYLALAGAVLIAHDTPATAYEVSIYAATPPGFWLGVGTALAIALVSIVGSRLVLHRQLAAVLGGLALFAIVALPVLRGYAFYGTGDSLSHLGWTRELLAGQLVATDLLYPGIHGIALFIDAATGVGLERALTFVVYACIAVFLASVPVLVGTLTDDRRVVGVAAVSAFMLLPINQVSAHMTAHPSTMAILFLPFVLLVLIRYLRTVESGWATPIGVVLGITTVATTLIHPQQAVNLLLVMLAIAGLDVISRRWGRPVDRRGLVGQITLLGGFFVAWTLSDERAISAVNSLTERVLFGAAGPSPIAQRSTSLEAIGASLGEVFVKLFLVSSVYGLLASGLVLALLLGVLRDRATARTARWLGLAFAPVGVLLVVFLLVNFSQLHFRQLGFLMVGATVLGAFALVAVSINRSPGTIGRRGGTVAAVVILGVLLVLSVAVIFPSPYIYQPNMHVTHAQFDGYDSAFATTDDDVAILGIRQGPDRYRDAIEGTGELERGVDRARRGVPGSVLAAGNLTEAYDGPRYLAVTPMDGQRELVAYRGLRYPSGSMTGIGTEAGVNRVMDNGGFELYHVQDR